MSWYNNNNESAFVDATQIQLGSSGSSSTTIVQNGNSVGIGGGGNTGIDTTISDLISLRFDDPNYNVYITNNNPNGLIYFRTSDNNNKIKIENGNLYVWYDYNPFISLTITSGWTHISDYIVTTRQGQLNNAVNIGVLDVAVLAPGTGLISRVTILEPIVASTTARSITNENRIARLEASSQIDEPGDLEFENGLTSSLDDLRSELGSDSSSFMNMIEDAAYQGGNARNLASNIRKSRFQLAQAFLTNLFAAIGGISFVVGIAYQIYDRWRDSNLYEDEKNLILTYEKIKNEPNASVANLIHKNGLIITQSTNNNFINAGTYEVNTSNNCVLIIIIKSVSGTLTAEIDSVKETGTGFAVNDVISIPKSSIGGTTGNLEIVVSTLYSEVQILAFDLDLITEERDQLVNRNRRRQFIPDKNDFGNGLTVTETNNTEPSGEITKALDISLKLDTSQFAYDGSGNLQLTNYNNLIYTSANGTVGINTTTPDAFIKLHCKGSAEFGDGVNINQTINVKSLNGYYILGTNNSGNGTNNNQFYIYDADDLTYRLTIQNGTGRVGIGTRTPGYKLDVYGDVNIGSLAKYKIGGANLQYSDLDNPPFTSIDTSTLSVDSNGELSVIGGGGTSSQWTTTGNDIYYNTGSVGINNSTPSSSYKLDVGGNINISSGSKYKINGNDLNYTDLAGNPPAPTSIPYNYLSVSSATTASITYKPDPILSVNTTASTNYATTPVMYQGTGTHASYKFVEFSHSAPTNYNQDIYTIEFTEETECDILVVAGGGGGGRSIGGGGGAGGVEYQTGRILKGTYTVKVGSGGAGGTVSGSVTEGQKGQNSDFYGGTGAYSVTTLLSYGGGGASGQSFAYNVNQGGARPSNQTTYNGGSGAGGTLYWTYGGSGISNQGYGGGTGGHNYGTAISYGGGGGGKSATGGNHSTGNVDGGAGSAFSFIPSTVLDQNSNNHTFGENGFFAGGGGGGGGAGSSGGTGGGGNGAPINVNGSNGLSNTGGGGGGGDNTATGATGGRGGSGVVIIRYKNQIPAGTSITPKGMLSYENNSWTFRDNDTLWMKSGNNIYRNNRIGINTTQPTHPLTVLGSGDNVIGNLYAFHHSNGSWGQNSGGSWSTLTSGIYSPIGLKVAEGIVAQRSYIFSDKRIKQNIIDIKDDEALITFRKLKPKKYEYIDKIDYGNNSVYGFIAQEVGEILPNSITYQKDYLPDIMKSAEVKIIGNNSQLILNETHEFKIGDMLRCKNDKWKNIDNVMVIVVIDDKNIIVNYKFEEQVVLIYGNYHHDFNVLNKESIWTLTTSALQEVDRQLQNEKSKFFKLQNKMDKLIKYLNIDESIFIEEQVEEEDSEEQIVNGRTFNQDGYDENGYDVNYFNRDGRHITEFI